MSFATPGEKYAALVGHATRVAESAAALEAEPATVERAVKAACLIACAEAERAKIMAAPCRPMRPSFRHGGRSVVLAVMGPDGNRESAQVAVRDS